jgi:NADH dehydrogenase
MHGDQQRIVILGGGFAGVYTAMYLEKGLRREERDRVEITLVSLENYMVFQPLLPEVISGTIDSLHCITPIRRLAKRTRLLTREIQAIDLEQKIVTLGPEFQPKTRAEPFDHLVIALGSRLNYDIVPGMREHAIPFKYLGDALRLRNAVVQVLEEADNELNAEERQRLLTFIVGGGGFSGVECIAELHDFLRSALPAYRNLKMSDLRVILLQSADRILPELGPDLAKYAHDILVKRGVEVLLNTRLQAVTADGAVLKRKDRPDAEFVPARIVVATVPSAPHQLIAGLPLEKDKAGRIVVTPEMHVADRTNVWSLGDCAAVPQPDGIMSPPTAQHALRQAKTCADNILATLRGQPPKKFAFTGLGKLASLGHRSAVAEVMGIKLRGFLAWVFWRGVYLSKFPGLDRKWRILTDWVLDVFLPRDITEVRIFHQEAVAREHYHSDETVFEQGDFGDKIYVVVTGEAEVIRDGKRIGELKNGDVFGEMALVSEKPRSATVRARTPLDLISISREAFHFLVTHLPGVKGSIDQILQQHLDANPLASKSTIIAESKAVGVAEPTPAT